MGQNRIKWSATVKMEDEEEDEGSSFLRKKDESSRRQCLTPDGIFTQDWTIGKTHSRSIYNCRNGTFVIQEIP